MSRVSGGRNAIGVGSRLERGLGGPVVGAIFCGEKGNADERVRGSRAVPDRENIGMLRTKRRLSA